MKNVPEPFLPRIILYSCAVKADGVSEQELERRLGAHRADSGGARARASVSR